MLVYIRFTVVYNVNVVQNAAHSDMYKDPFGSFFMNLKYNPESMHIGMTTIYRKVYSK